MMAKVMAAVRRAAGRRQREILQELAVAAFAAASLSTYKRSA